MLTIGFIDPLRAASKFMIDTGAGVIDSDYRGVVFVLLFNFSDSDFESECLLITFLGMGAYCWT